MLIDPLVRELFNRWGFVPTEELAPGHCCRVYADHEKVAKVPFQGEELTTGFRAAYLLSERGSPLIFDGDADTGVVLMQRLWPGTKLSESEKGDREAFEIIRDQIRQLKDLPTLGFPDLSSYLFLEDPLVQFMLETEREKVFLHGDLHHENVLLGLRGWTTIDPKGLAGDRAFEAAAFIRNPIPWLTSWPNLEEVLTTRIQWWAEELDSDPWRIWGWTVACLRDGEPVTGSHWDIVREVLEQLWPDEVPSRCR